MLYINSLSRSHSARRFLWTMVGLPSAGCLAVIVMAWRMPEMAGPRWFLTLWFGTLALLEIVLMLIGAHQTVRQRVEITAEGVFHLAPGKPKTLLWRDLVAIDSVPRLAQARHRVALGLRTATQRYVLRPPLVPEGEDSPTYEFTGVFVKPYWLYPDGRREPITATNTFVHRALKAARPDLLSDPA
jgi:hypothetical protein